MFLQQTIKLFFSFFVFLCINLVTYAQEAILMTINQTPITKGEFTYAYLKNNQLQIDSIKTPLKDYINLYADYKRKVEEAKQLGIDTTEAFKKEYALYRDLRISSFLIDSTYLDSLAKDLYQQIVKQMNGKDLLKVRHIYLKSSKGDSLIKKQKIDSIYNLITKGADFAILAKDFSDDKASAEKGGELPWFGLGSMLKEFEDQAYALSPKTVSKPFLSSAGYHIIQVLETKPLEDYNTKKASILAYLKQSGAEEKAIEHSINNKIIASNGELTKERILEETLVAETAKNAELKYLLQEYYDGLLLIAATEKEVWEKAKQDTLGLANYFAKHQDKYTWQTPQFKGFVVYTRDKKQEKKVKRWILKHQKDLNFQSNLKNKFNKDSLMVKVYYGVFSKDAFPEADQWDMGGQTLVFDSPLKHQFLVGKDILKAEEWKDDKATVIADYQKEKEKDWVEKLRKKYPLNLNEEVFNTLDIKN